MKSKIKASLATLGVLVLVSLCILFVYHYPDFFFATTSCLALVWLTLSAWNAFYLHFKSKDENPTS
jgi:hypothetical protein